MFPSSCPMSSLLTERPVLSEDDLTQTQSPAQTGRIFLSIVMTELSLSVLLSAKELQSEAVAWSWLLCYNF